MTRRVLIGLALVLCLLPLYAWTTYGEKASPVAWEARVRGARWISSEPPAFSAYLVLTQTGRSPARSVRLWIHYPDALFDITDLHRPKDTWLPFIGGLAIREWQPGTSIPLEFGFRYLPSHRQQALEQVKKSEFRIQWREGDELRELVLPLPPFEVEGG